MMSSDIFYSIGSTHQVCQDFAIADGDFVVLCDGCSSAQDSDWGARLLAKACHNVFKKEKRLDDQLLTHDVLNMACTYVNSLGLDLDCLAATLLAAYRQDNKIEVVVIGDGSIILHNRKHPTIEVVTHEYETNAPYYLYYNLNDSMKKNYFMNYGRGKLIIESMGLDEDGVECEDNEYSDILECELIHHYSFSLDLYDTIALSSDGLKSFIKQVKGATSITNKTVAIEDVVKDLFAFKNMDGQFVHRRCQRFLKDCAAQNIKHTDDFSVGVIHVGS